MERKTVEFEDRPDSAEVQKYRDRISAARQRGGETGPAVGGSKPLDGTPNIIEAQEQARAGRALPEQERDYSPQEYQNLIASGKAVHGIGGAVPANQRISTGAAPVPGVLSEETIKGLEAMAAQEDKEEKTPEEAASVDSKSAKDADFFKMLMGQPVDVLQRAERRSVIEGRLEEIDIRHILVGKGCIQTVPIIPDVFEVTFRQLNAREDIFSKRKTWEIVREEAGENTSQAYYDTVFGLVNVVLSVTCVNDEDQPDHRTDTDEVNEEVFDKKFDSLMRRPFVVLQDLWINFSWFDDRIRQKLNVGSLGNG